MADDVPKIVQEILDLDPDLKQTGLAKKIGVSQSTINRWRQGNATPNIVDWDKAMKLWRELRGMTLSIDQKIAPYDEDTQRRIHEMVDVALSLVPPPLRR